VLKLSTGLAVYNQPQQCVAGTVRKLSNQ